MNGNAGQTEPEQERKDKLQGIRGWLVIPAVQLVFGLLLHLLTLFASFSMYQEFDRAGYGRVYIFELIISLGLFVFMIYAALRFFKKKMNAQKTMVVLYSVLPFTAVIILLTEASAGAPYPVLSETGKQLVVQIVSAFIWIPYFNVSKRVKATFVN